MRTINPDLSFHGSKTGHSLHSKVITGYKVAGYDTDLHLDNLSHRLNMPSRFALVSGLPSFSKSPLPQYFVFILHSFGSILIFTQAPNLIIFSLSSFV